MGTTRNQKGEFYTPECIAEMMAKMSVSVEEILERDMPFTICEPTCGSGRMVLAVAKLLAPEKKVDLIRATCWDVSPTAVDMTLINTTLW